MLVVVVVLVLVLVLVVVVVECLLQCPWATAGVMVAWLD